MPEAPRPSSAAARALGTVTERARSALADDLERIERALGRPVHRSDLVRWGAAIRDGSRLTLNFHPDRPDLSGNTIAAGLAETGRYYSQFVTGWSNGGRSAVEGGQRDTWERLLFGGAYEAAPGHERPLYGALDLFNDSHGGAPRFGSSFVVLSDEVFDRCTFTVGDSHAGPTDVATAEAFSPVIAGVLDAIDGGVLFGRTLGPDAADRFLSGAIQTGGAARLLDPYVEVQVHGGVSLETDVVAIVVDPSLRSSSVQLHLEAASERFGFDLAWHRGSRLLVADVPSDFRGEGMPALAAQVAGPDGVVDARRIGDAAMAIPTGDPTPDGDAEDSDRQQLKYLWHTLLAWGTDAVVD